MLNQASYHEDVLGNRDIDSRYGRFTPRDGDPITYWTVSLMEPRSSLDAVEEKTSCFCRSTSCSFALSCMGHFYFSYLSYKSDAEGCRLLGYNVVRREPYISEEHIASTFRSKNKPRGKSSSAFCMLPLFSCLACSSSLKMEAIYSFETLRSHRHYKALQHTTPYSSWSLLWEPRTHSHTSVFLSRLFPSAACTMIARGVAYRSGVSLAIASENFFKQKTPLHIPNKI